jgi:hypothetical protein
MTRARNTLGRMISVTLAVAAFGAPAIAIADTAKEQQLEARIAELEKQVQALLATQKAAPAPAPAAATAAAPAKAPIQGVSITPNAAPNTTFLLTGFVKADALFTKTSDGDIADNSVGRDFYVPGVTPVGGNGEGDFDLNAHVKQSRVNFGTDTILEGGDKLSTRFEIDFFGSVTGDQRISNTYAPVLRHAYVTWRHWLVGQTWSNFMDVATLPESVDFIGPTDGTSFVRQPQVRWTSGGLSVSAENRETTITPYRGGGRIASDDGWVPDLTARYAWKGSWGHFAVAGMLRELVYETSGANAIDASTWSGSLSASGKFNIGKDDIRWMALYGNLGRYVGLNFANDAVIDGSGDLDSIDGFAAFAAYRHIWGSSGKLRSTFMYALQDYDNDANLTGGSANKSSWSAVANIFYSPLPKLDIGAEYRYGVREIENGTDGDFNRLQFTTKYSF